MAVKSLPGLGNMHCGLNWWEIFQRFLLPCSHGEVPPLPPPAQPSCIPTTTNNSTSQTPRRRERRIKYEHTLRKWTQSIKAIGKTNMDVKGRVADPDPNQDLFGQIQIWKIFTRSGSYRYFGNVKLFKQGKSILKVEVLHVFR